RVDSERLSRQLGVPVVPIQANKRRGLDRLKQEILKITEVAFPNTDEPSTQYSVPRTQYPVLSTQYSPVAKAIPFPPPFEREEAGLRDQVGPSVPSFLVRRLLLDAGGATEERLVGRNGSDLRRLVQQARQRLAAAGCPVPAVEARARYAWIRQAT